MTSLDQKTDEGVRSLFLGNLNKLRTLLTYRPAKANMTVLDKLDKVIDELHRAQNSVSNDKNATFFASNSNLEKIYTDLRDQQAQLPSVRQHAERVRESLIRQEFKANWPQPRFDKTVFDAVINQNSLKDVNTRPLFIFEMLFADLVSQKGTKQEATGIPKFDSTENIRQKLESCDYSEAKIAWQKGQIGKMICEFKITGKSSNAAVNRLLNMKDSELSATLASVIDDGLKDLKRRTDETAKCHESVEAAFDRIEQLWAKRPTVKFAQDKPKLYKKLDRYLFRSNIEQFLRKFIGPAPDPVPLALPQNPLQAVKSTIVQKSQFDSGLPRSRQPVIQSDSETTLPPSLLKLTKPDDPEFDGSTDRGFRRTIFTDEDNKDSSTDPMDLGNDDDSYQTTIKTGHEGMKDIGQNSSSTPPEKSPAIDGKLATSTSGEHLKRRQLRITFDTTDEGELRIILGTPGTNTFIGRGKWFPNYVDLEFKVDIEAKQFKDNFKILEHNHSKRKFNIESISNDRAHIFKDLLDTSVSRPDSIPQGFDPGRIVDILNIDTSKQQIFSFVEKFARWNKIDVQFFTEQVSKKCSVGFKNRPDAQEFQKLSMVDEDLWKDFLGENVKTVYKTPSAPTKATKTPAGGNLVQITSKNSKTPFDPVKLRKRLEKIQTDESLTFAIPNKLKSTVTIKLDSAEDSVKFTRALRPIKNVVNYKIIY